LETDHRGDLRRHGVAGSESKPLRVCVGPGLPVGDGDSHRKVRQRIVRARLIGHHIDRNLARQVSAEHLGKDLGSVANKPNGPAPPLCLGPLHRRECLVEVGRHFVEVSLTVSPP
jgi:hypothetical protein